MGFIHGVQLIYELQTLSLPKPNTTIVNFTQFPMPKGFEALVRIPWRGPGCTGIIATCADGTVSHARNLDFSPVSFLPLSNHTHIMPPRRSPLAPPPALWRLQYPICLLGGF